MRFSKQRQLILDTLKIFPVHPTAEQLYEKVRIEMPSISLGTVYRNLALLVEQKEIRRFDSPGETSVRYDGRNDDHSHLVCTSCNKVFDVDSETFKELDDTLTHLTGFIVKQHDIVLKGVCKECSEKTNL
ncbi:MAG: transcriptional repressor [Spirochaetia bacterium]|nr:transcriptional repressor [Spirochaetia bacterium]